MNDQNLTLRSQFFNHLAQTAADPPALEISHGNGCYLYDTDGREYLDCISGISVASLGHNNAGIKKAVTDQINAHSHVMVFGEYILHPQVTLAAKLASLLPQTLSSVFFTNSGAEAIEGAMKLVKRYTGKSKLVACKNAYHGSTQGALSLMGNEFFKQAFRPLLPNVHFIEFNNCDELHVIDQDTAAVFVEPVQSETGYLPGSAEFIEALRIRCDQTGALLVLDEVQSGMCRTGKMFGFEHYNICPDVLVLAKALGGGYPLGAFITSKHIMDTLGFDPPLGHITTFGGHPVSCAASLAVLNEVLQNGFKERVTEKEQLFRSLLSKHISPEKISGRGLMLAIHFENETKCKKIIYNCLDHGLLADWFLFAPNAMRITPPLIIDEQQIEKICEIIAGAVR